MPRFIALLRAINVGGSRTFATVPLGKALDRPFTIRSTRTIKTMAAKYGSTR